VILLAFKAMWFVYFALFFFFFSFSDKKIHLETFGGKLLLLFMSPVECIASFPLFFDAIYLLLHRLLRDTRSSDESTIDLWSCHCLLRLCGLPATGT
jgi:hypothetical protein